jgi:hypothetical protein
LRAEDGRTVTQETRAERPRSTASWPERASPSRRDAAWSGELSTRVVDGVSFAVPRR